MSCLLSSGSSHGYLSSLVGTLVSSVIVSVHVDILGISDGSISLSYANKVAGITLSCMYWSIGKCLELLAWIRPLDQASKYPISLPNVNSTIESDELCISKQHLLFSNLTSIGCWGNVVSNGLTYATPFPIIVFWGMNVVLLVFKAAETIPVHPGKILTLFFATNGMEISCM